MQGFIQVLVVSSLQDDVNGMGSKVVVNFQHFQMQILHIGQFNPRYCYRMKGLDIIKENENILGC